MFTRNSERGSGDSVFMGLLAFIALIVFFVVLVGGAIIDGRKRVVFDAQVEREDIVFTANFLSLGESGNPAFTLVTDLVPLSTELIKGEQPRMFEVEDCGSFLLPEGTQGLYVATAFPQPELIEIVMPARDSGTMNLCVPNGAKIQIIMWVK